MTGIVLVVLLIGAYQLAKSQIGSALWRILRK